MPFVFSKQPLGYKAGLFMLVSGLVLYMVGFFSPNWTSFHLIHREGTGTTLDDPLFVMSMRGHNGLWQTCEKMLGYERVACRPASPQHGAPGWISAVQGMQCLGLLGLLAACGYAVAINFIQQAPDFTKHYLEILIFASGILGVIGSIIYVTQSSGNNDIVKISDDLDMIFFVDVNMKVVVDQNDLSWAFGLNLLGCFLAFVSSIVLCAFTRLLDAPPEAPSVAVSFSGGSPA
ncbi:hypothetical protein ACOMHN_021033 [Nucella lapillus]